MPRGGRRSGKPGQAYANRSDLSVNKGPVAMGNYASGQPYGTGVQMSDAQRAMPVSSPAAPGVAQGPQPPPELAALLGGGGPAPGEMGGFSRPTERPNEPITHGLPSGPGAGPEILRGQPAMGARNLLQQMANQPYASDDIRMLLNILSR